MDMTEKTLSRDTLFEGRLLKLQVDRVSLPDGAAAEREVVFHPGGVGIVALTEEDEVLLVRQYRYPFAAVTREIPAGKKESGEDPLVGAKRELAEETGFVAEHWRKLGALWPTPGFCTEADDLYLATGLTDLRQHPESLPEGAQMPHPDDDEFIEVERLPLAQAVEQILRGEIPDAKTQVGLLMARLLREKEEV
ncbi:MAG: NUDIX hydrolase [Clostridia bacterium]|nr:NUDIX hydrolase [Clostridia bacterium]